MKQGIGAPPPSVPPPLKPQGKSEQVQRSGPADKAPSLAQFAINQMVHRTPEGVSTANLQSLSIFKDMDSGQYVTIVREQGEIKEQIPDDKLLEFYTRLEKELNQESIHRPVGDSGMDFET